MLIAAKEMARYARDHADFSPAVSQSTQELVYIVYKPVRTYLEHCAYTTADDINPNYIKPNGMMYRMMKATHEYGAGTATFYQTTTKNLEIIMDMLSPVTIKRSASPSKARYGLFSLSWAFQR